MRLLDPLETSSSAQKCERRIDILRRHVEPGGKGAELGVFKGAFIDYLLSLNPKKLYLVDPWYRISSEWSWAKGEKSTVRALIRILEEYEHEIGTGVMEPRVTTSQDFLKGRSDNELDWVYIDSTHGYGQTKLELELAAKKVRKGGLIMGDDYRNVPEHKHYGVFKAVQEASEAALIEIVVDGDDAQFVSINLVD